MPVVPLHDQQFGMAKGCRFALKVIVVIYLYGIIRIQADDHTVLYIDGRNPVLGSCQNV
jgi:hypothetical protein